MLCICFFPFFSPKNCLPFGQNRKAIVLSLHNVQTELRTTAERVGSYPETRKCKCGKVCDPATGTQLRIGDVYYLNIITILWLSEPIECIFASLKFKQQCNDKRNAKISKTSTKSEMKSCFSWILSSKMEEGKSTTAQSTVWINGALDAVMKMILNTTETQHNYSLYLNSLKRYKTFQEELEHNSGRSVQLLMSGSVAENLFAIHWPYLY